MSGVRALLSRPVLEAARALPGWRLRSLVGGEICEVVLTQVEAYGGSDDPASHGYRGETVRNRSMFREAGTLYVYRSYGIHWCLNAVTGEVGQAAAVLLRAARPVVGEDVMIRRRGRADHLADGPGRLAQALGATGDHDGTSLVDGPLRLLPPLEAAGPVSALPRVGIRRAADRRWRFALPA